MIKEMYGITDLFAGFVLIFSSTRLHAANTVIKAFIIRFFDSPKFQQWAEFNCSEDMQATLRSLRSLHHMDYLSDAIFVKYFSETSTALTRSLTHDQIHILSQIACHFNCQNGNPSRKLIRFVGAPFHQLEALLCILHSFAFRKHDRREFRSLAVKALYLVDYHTIKTRFMLSESSGFI